MITIAKLKTLKDRTCVRKTALLFHQMAASIPLDSLQRAYLGSLAGLFTSEQFSQVLTETEQSHLLLLARRLESKEGKDLALLCEDIHYFLLGVLGSDPSDWDFVDQSGNLDASRRRILGHTLILDRLRSPHNIRSIFRSADSFGVKKIYLVEGCADVNHPRCLRTSRGCTDTVDHEVISEDALLLLLRSSSLPLFALETGGTSVDLFPFPEEGFSVIGGEELGVSPSLLALCEASLGRLSIEMGGTKGSLNVAVAAGIMLHSWYTT
jgi:TrmH family RNA methyltransferase